jgi:FtsP/CotA-like multicopper oxidase with cupredoxin domain
MTVAVAALSFAATGVIASAAATPPPAHNNHTVGRKQVGPLDEANGFPLWYKDTNNVKLELCLDPSDSNCIMGDVPDPTKPVSFPDNFPDEAPRSDDRDRHGRRSGPGTRGRRRFPARHGRAVRDRRGLLRLPWVKITLRNRLPKNNVDYTGITEVMQFRVGRADPSTTVDNEISPNWAERIAPVECMSFTESDLKQQSVPEREFKFIRTNSKWTINGETWENVIDSQYTHCMAEPDEDAVEIWKLTNASGGWFHPVHIHLVDFQILSRTLLTSTGGVTRRAGAGGAQCWLARAALGGGVRDRHGGVRAAAAS